MEGEIVALMDGRSLVELLGSHASGRGIEKIEKIRSEASLRQFFRIHRRWGTQVAMVYPEASAEEIARICRFVSVYRRHGICVPDVHAVVADRVLLMDDAGNQLLQRLFRTLAPRTRERIVGQWAELLGRLHRIDASETRMRLDGVRMRWELGFFLRHFPNLFPRLRPAAAELEPLLDSLSRSIDKESTFAHRDFHTRNMLWWQSRICLVDFQDSLVAPVFYDLVSLAFDSYCDLKQWRNLLWREVEKNGIAIDRRQLLLTALQRNIKALGTFACQVTERGNGNYRRYVPRTLRHVLGHLAELGEGDWSPLRRFFNRVAAALRGT